MTNHVIRGELARAHARARAWRVALLVLFARDGGRGEGPPQASKLISRNTQVACLLACLPASQVLMVGRARRKSSGKISISASVARPFVDPFIEEGEIKQT